MRKVNKDNGMMMVLSDPITLCRKVEDLVYSEQKIVSMSKTVLIVISLIVIVGCKQSSKTALPYYNEASFSPLFLTKDLANKKITHHVAHFSFLDQDGNIFNSDQLQGKIHVTNFFFTGCGSICPGMMSKLSSVQQQFKEKDIYFLSFSVTQIGRAHV